MGLFNRLHHLERCPNCRKINYYVSQYKYGYIRQLDYLLGEEINLSDDDENAVVEAYSENSCKFCNVEIDFNILIEAGYLASTTERTIVENDDVHTNERND